jgi:tetratricopeptide (TPR) repeat protein
MRNPKSEVRNPKEIRKPKTRNAIGEVRRLFGFRDSGFFRISDMGLRISLLALTLLGCSPKKEAPPSPPASAQALFAQATTNFHLPSAEANGAERTRLLGQAAATYLELLKKYPDNAYWAAQALRNLGNVRAAQGRTNEAVKIYASVESRYPQQRWEVLAALKSAGDLLWDARRQEEARRFYQKIVVQFDTTNATQVEKTIIRGAQRRLTNNNLPALQ